MRHKVYGKHLGRDKNQRTALFKSLVRSLVIHEKIETTESKAKAVKGLVDKLVTQAKSPTTKRLVAQFLTDKQIHEKFMNDITPRLSNRTSGYTSVVKLGRRAGDGAMIVSMSLLVEKSKPVKSVKSGISPVASQSEESEKVEEVTSIEKTSDEKSAKKEKK